MFTSNPNKCCVTWYELEKYSIPYIGVTIQIVLREVLLLNLV